MLHITEVQSLTEWTGLCIEIVYERRVVAYQSWHWSAVVSPASALHVCRVGHCPCVFIFTIHVTSSLCLA